MKMRYSFSLAGGIPLAFGAAAALCFCCTPHAVAADLLVSNNKDSGPGSLRQAVLDNNSLGGGNTIAFSNIVTGAITLTNGELLIATDVTLVGPGPRTLAVDGNAVSRVFHVTNAAHAFISGLTITNGMVSVGSPVVGGGIWVDTSTLTLSNCSVSGNYLSGIYNDHSTLTLVNCTVSNNQVTGASGGGIHSYGYAGNATVTAIGCTFSHNTTTGANNGGGAIFSDGNFGSATLLVSNSTFSGNSAYEGGAIYNSGAFGISNSELTVRGCTFADNSSTSGSAIFMNGSNSVVRLGNTILKTAAGSTLDVSGGFLISNFTNDGYNISNDGARGLLTKPTDQINTDPLLDVLANNGGPTLTHALLTGSPAIDRGNSFGLTTDQRGEPRPVDFASITNASGGDGSDIGAFEVGSPRLPSGPFQLDGDATTDGSRGDDWDVVLLGNGGSAIASVFLTDPVNTNADDIFFLGGSKDTLGIQAGPWLFTSAKPQAKDDIEHAFAAAYVAPPNHLIFYFGADRFDTNGTAIGFWFLQNPVSLNPGVTNSSGHPFVGQHADGDILVLCDFSVGSSMTNATVYRWTGNDPTGSLVFVPAPTNTTGSTYVIVNSAPISMPWPYVNKAGTNMPAAGEFLEGAIDLTAFGLDTSASFATFEAETRSSTSPTATLSDFVLGAFDFGRPRLNIQQFGNAAVLSWPSYYTNLTLQSSPNLGSVTNWVNASGSAALIGNQYRQTNSPISGNEFYRLRGN
jgi:hypothetical protein